MTKRIEKNVAIIFAILLGFLFSLHLIIIPLFLTPKGQVFVPFGYKDEGGYLSIVRKAADGSMIPGDSQLFEHINLPYLHWAVFIPYIIVTKITGSLFFSIFLGRFFVNSLIFLLFYIILRKQLDFISSLVISLGVIVGFRLISHFPPFTLLLLKGFINDLNLSNIDGFSFGRFFPYANSFVLLLFSIYLLQNIVFFNGKKTIFTAFVASLLFYSYVYHWTFFYAGAALFLIYAMIIKNNNICKKLTRFFLYTGIFIIPYIYLYVLNSKLDLFHRVIQNNGRYVEWIISLRYLVLAFLFSIIIIPSKKSPLVLFPIFLIAGVICLNVQLLTGFTIQPDHWIMVIEPFGFISGFIIIFHLLNKFHWKNYLKILILVYFLLVAIILRIRSLSLQSHHFISSETEEIIHWLNKNTKIDDVVVTTDTSLSFDLPTLTHNRVFLPNSYHTYASDEEILQRIFWVYQFSGINSSEFAKKLSISDFIYLFFNCSFDFNKRKKIIDYEFPGNIKQKILKLDGTITYPNFVRYIPDNIKRNILNDYAKEWKYDNNRKNYFILKKNIDIPSNSRKMLIEVYENKGYTIFKFKKA